MLGIKYVVFCLLWAVGCFCNRLDIRPRLVSISPYFNSKRWLEKMYALSILFCGLCMFILGVWFERKFGVDRVCCMRKYVLLLYCIVGLIFLAPWYIDLVVFVFIICFSLSLVEVSDSIGMVVFINTFLFCL